MSRDGGRRWRAILAGAIVGFPMGVVGLAIGRESFAWLSVVLGAACGGATAAALSDRGLRGAVVTAAIADALRSLLIVLLLILPALLSADGAVETGLATLFLLFVGVLFGGPIALVSMGVAAVAGLATALLQAAVR